MSTNSTSSSSPSPNPNLRCLFPFSGNAALILRAFVYVLSGLIVEAPTFASARVNRPAVGDFALYHRHIVEKTPEIEFRDLELNREILSYDSKHRVYLVKFGKNEGQGWSYSEQELTLLDYSYGLFADCENQNGTRTQKTVAAGDFEACERQRTNYIDWHGEVPFGLLRAEYADSDVEFRTELTGYKQGAP